MSRLIYLLILLLKFASEISCISEYRRDDFPPDFIFGSGTSAYQVEGAANEDGRSPGIWDFYAHTGKMGGETGDVSVDQYHKYKEDVKLMAETGLDAYRFSISWSRLIPSGRGAVNPKGLQYYNNLINELIKNGIEPHVTLYHFDHPQILEDNYGGWLSQKIVKDFTAYAEVCFREFGDRVLYWTTLNEPNIIPIMGYDEGIMPPGRCSPPFGINCTIGNSSSEPYSVAHHILLAHASVVWLYRTKYQPKQLGFIGINLFAFGAFPVTNSTKDVLATRRANDFWIGLFMHPLVYGEYPDSVKRNAGSRLPDFTKNELNIVKGSFDFVGVNHYVSVQFKDNSESLNSEHRDLVADMAVEMIAPDMINTTGYPISPWGMQAALEYFKQEYGNPPIYIHENGQVTRRTSSLNDTTRVQYMQEYIGSVLNAIRNGSDTRGYFTWSFLDVFELLGGYKTSFGLYHVDMDDPDLKRVPKLSAQWYSRFLKGGIAGSGGVIQLPDNPSDAKMFD